MEERIIEAFWHGIVKDVREYQKIEHDKGYFSFEEEGQWSYKTEILLITIKSLRPLQEKVAIEIDSSRFLEELKLWRYYRHGGSKKLIYLGDDNLDYYWEKGDELLALRGIVLALVNSRKSELQDVLLKHILWSTGSLESLFEIYALSMSMYYWQINKGNIDKDRMRELVKEELMSFSRERYLDLYGKHYRKPLETRAGHLNVDFEREKIKILTRIDSWLENREKLREHEVFYEIFIEALVEKNAEDGELLVKDQDFIEAILNYLIRLRKGRVQPSNLKTKFKHLNDPFEYSEGERIVHDLLKEAVVLKKGENDKYVKMIVDTKIGRFRFFKIKNK